MNQQVNKVTNGVVYFNGVSCMGRAEEVTCPEVAVKMVDHKALGMVGELELPAGLQKMSAKIKWNAIYPDAMKSTHDAFTPIRAMVMGNIESYEGGRRVSQVPVIVYMTLTPKKAGGLVFKPQDNIEREDEFNCTAYKLEIDGEEIIDIDIIANVWRVNGIDQLAAYRSNLGLV